MKTLNLEEAAQFLKIHPEELRRRAGFVKELGSYPKAVY